MQSYFTVHNLIDVASGILADVNFSDKSGCGTSFSAGANICYSEPVMAINENFSMAASAILNFVGYEF